MTTEETAAVDADVRAVMNAVADALLAHYEFTLARFHAAMAELPASNGQED